MTSKWGWKPIESLAASASAMAMLASIPFCSRWLIVFHQTFFLCCWLEWRQSLLPLAFPREFPERSSASIREHTHTAFVLLLKSMKMALRSWEPIVLIRRRSIWIGGWWACFQSRLALLLLYIGIYSIPYMHSRLKIKIWKNVQLREVCLKV